MSRFSPASTSRDPFRAVFLCLLVLAQMLLPPVFAQARASQADGCVSLVSGASESGKASKQIPHAHSQECAHCRPQAMVLMAPAQHPDVTVAPAFAVEIARADVTGIETRHLPLPPATGPPVVLFSV